MDLHQRMSADSWMNCNELPKKVPPDHQSFTTNFAPPPYQQKWEDPSILDYGMRIEEANSPKFNPPSCEAADVQDMEINGASRIPDWDPRAMLNNLSFLEQKIHQLQDLVHLVVSRNGETPVRSDQLVAQQQQLITADLTSIIVQLISTAGSLLPSMKQNLSANPALSEFGEIIFPSGSNVNGCAVPQKAKISASTTTNNNHVVDHPTTSSCKTEQHCSEEHEQKEEEDADEGENLAPGSYEILQLEKEEILAPHTHFCVICGKGFKRDANLRMHMRGHGDEYKTAAALAKPNKELSSSSSAEPLLIKRYSCPYSGCKRNKDHKKFQPLKTILCVKNHYKRTHCDKRYTCSRCNTKKFSVIADLKTHEKHCGRDKWLCSCGTTFSRKDKLFGHIALFQGHTPAIPLDETKASGCSSRGENCETSHNTGFGGGLATFRSNFGSKSVENGSRGNNHLDDEGGFFLSPVNFETCNLAGFHEFPRPTFEEDSENSFSFLLSGSYNNYPQKNEGEGGLNHME